MVLFSHQSLKIVHVFTSLLTYHYSRQEMLKMKSCVEGKDSWNDGIFFKDYGAKVQLWQWNRESSSRIYLLNIKWKKNKAFYDTLYNKNVLMGDY